MRRGLEAAGDTQDPRSIEPLVWKTSLGPRMLLLKYFRYIPAPLNAFHTLCNPYRSTSCAFSTAPKVPFVLRHLSCVVILSEVAARFPSAFGPARPRSRRIPLRFFQRPRRVPSLRVVGLSPSIR